MILKITELRRSLRPLSSRPWTLGRVAAFAFLASLSSVMQVPAAEYFVAPGGSDASDGLALPSAFRTIQRGVTALSEGDTLTIGPGQYFESVSRDHLGGAEAETTIRAAIPGTVWLRGDVPAPEFKPIKGKRFIYVADFDQSAQAVNEIDTYTILQQMPSVAALEFAPGNMHYDAARKKLYISTSDLQPPSKHRYTVSVLKGSGMRFDDPKRVRIEGLAFTGFNNRNFVARPPGGIAYMDGVRWGLLLDRATQCVIRDCLASFNADGIGVRSSPTTGGNLIERCEAFANNSRFTQEGANIIVYFGNNDVIRDSVAYIGDLNGIRFYNNPSGPVTIEHCLAWGVDSGSLSMKGGEGITKWGRVVRSVGLGKTRILFEENSLSSLLGGRSSASDLSKDVDYDKEFADSENFDFRLQPKSKFRATAAGGVDKGPRPYEKNIFYADPQGNDAADGLSTKTPWKSLARALKDLKAGDTLYMLPGIYQGDVSLKITGDPARPVHIRGRGRNVAVVEGKFQMEDSDSVKIERLKFEGELKVEKSADIAFTNCTFAGGAVGLAVAGVQGLRVEHSLFSGQTKASLLLHGTGTAKNAGVFLSSNIFDNPAGAAIEADGREGILFSDYNAFRQEKNAWKISGRAVSLATLRPRHEVYSQVLASELTVENGTDPVANKFFLSGRGRLGKPLGRFAPPTEKVFHVTKPIVHSVSDTTANLEWVSSLPGNYELAWGETPELSNRIPYQRVNFCAMSLIDLKPDTEYFFQIRSMTPGSAKITPGSSLEEKGFTVTAPQKSSEVISFRTAAAPHPPRTFHVSAGGDDRRDGLSRETAWKTIAHAADQVNAGDTVLIGDGVYSEKVHMRATGTRKAPITFKAAPGERPVLDGDTRKLSTAFVIYGKNSIYFDGFSLTQFNNESHDSGLRSGVFQTYRSNDIRISRCFMDGRGPSYSPWFLVTEYCRGVTMNNCVIIASYNALFIQNSPDTIIEHCVFLRPMIAIAWIRNSPNEKVIFRNNIVTDGLPKKAHVPLFQMDVNSLVEESNYYWLRKPLGERKTFGDHSLALFQTIRSKGSSVAGDPKFAVLSELNPPKGDDPLSRDFDALIKVEVKLDFQDLIATAPEARENEIGLQPSAFQDMPVKRLPLSDQEQPLPEAVATEPESENEASVNEVKKTM